MISTFKIVDQLAQTLFTKADGNIIDVRVVEKVRVIGCMHTADYDRCRSIFFDLSGQSQHGVGFASHGGQPDQVRGKGRQGLFHASRVGFEIKNPQLVLGQVPGQGFQA